MDIPEVGRFSVEKRLWCDQFINWYLSCDLLDKSSKLKLRTLKTAIPSVQGGEMFRRA